MGRNEARRRETQFYGRRQRLKAQQRLEAARDPKTPWKKWGPYLSERQWGTVREDYSDNGAGLGASHQTGWTGVIARAMHLFATTSEEQVLELGKTAAVVETDQPAGRRQTTLVVETRRP